MQKITKKCRVVQGMRVPEGATHFSDGIFLKRGLRDMCFGYINGIWLRSHYYDIMVDKNLIEHAEKKEKDDIAKIKAINDIIRSKKVSLTYRQKAKLRAESAAKYKADPRKIITS